MTKKIGRPATGQTPQRSLRVPDDVWLCAKAKAQSRGETVSDAVVRFLREYGASR